LICAWSPAAAFMASSLARSLVSSVVYASSSFRVRVAVPVLIFSARADIDNS
jgi:hypothetical protein